MSEQPYTPYHPRWYRPRMSTWWWLKRWSSLRFILRELSSIFVAWFVIFFLLFVRAISQGEAAYEGFLQWATRPYLLAVNLISLLFVVFHAVTWFNLAPQAMVLRFRGKRLPGKVITLSNYAAWAVVSAAVAWVLIGKP